MLSGGGGGGGISSCYTWKAETAEHWTASRPKLGQQQRGQLGHQLEKENSCSS
jgi:hypothetical protein